MQKTILAPAFLREHLKGVCPEPTVIHVTEFDDASVLAFNRELNEAVAKSQPFVPICINSFGGSVYSLLGMIAAMRACSVPTVTIVEGKAMSAGAVLFLIGDKRFMSPIATLMIHEVNCYCYGKVTDMKVEVSECDRLNRLIFTAVEEHCGYKKPFILDRLRANGNSDWYLTAREAKKLRFCTEIKVPELVTELDIKFYLK